MITSSATRRVVYFCRALLLAAALLHLCGCLRAEQVRGRYWPAERTEVDPNFYKGYEGLAEGHRMTGQKESGAAVAAEQTLNFSPLTIRERMRYPEIRLRKINLKHIEKDRVTGVCFSGGGMRAASAALGQLRALHELELIEEIDYISAVSGGAWSAVPFTYLPADFNTEEFLGDYIPPEDLTESNLIAARHSHAEVIASPPSVNWRTFWNTFARFQYSESYTRALGSKLLRHWKLDEDRLFTLDDPERQLLLSQNPHLGRRDFYIVEHPGRPFLIVGGCVPKYSLWPGNWGQTYGRRLPLELTPIYSGVPFMLEDADGRRTGGIYVESMLYDSRYATLWQEDDGTFMARAQLANRLILGLIGTFNCPRLTLRDLLGISGSAPGEFWISVPMGVTPILRHWTADSPPQDALLGELEVESNALPHSDGGLVENLGLMPLLSRRVDKIVAFVNTSTPLTIEDGELAGLPAYVRGYFDSHLPREFADGERRLNKVFDHRALKHMSEDLKTQLSRRSRRGPLVHHGVYRVQDNVVHGIAPVEPYDVEILWVFLDEGGWRRELEDEAVREVLTEGHFRSFPHYSTFDTGLTYRQSAALAHMTSWGLMQHAVLVREVLTGPRRFADPLGPAVPFKLGAPSRE